MVVLLPFYFSVLYTASAELDELYATVNLLRYRPSWGDMTENKVNWPQRVIR
jgi:hypothetical protein